MEEKKDFIPLQEELQGNNDNYLSEDDFISLPEEKSEHYEDYKKLREDFIKELYKTLDKVSTENAEFSKKNGKPYKDNRGYLWVPTKFEKNGKLEEIWVQLYEDGTKIKILNDSMYQELKLDNPNNELSLLSFHKVLRQNNENFLELLKNKSCQFAGTFGSEIKRLYRSRGLNRICGIGYISGFIAFPFIASPYTLFHDRESGNHHQPVENYTVNGTYTGCQSNWIPIKGLAYSGTQLFIAAVSGIALTIPFAVSLSLVKASKETFCKPSVDRKIFDEIRGKIAFINEAENRVPNVKIVDQIIKEKYNEASTLLEAQKSQNEIEPNPLQIEEKKEYNPEPQNLILNL